MPKSHARAWGAPPATRKGSSTQMASRGVSGRTIAAERRPGHAANRPRTAGADAAPKTRARK
eukprot:10346568-Alexandrium_andersonii.AAC.1